MADGCYALGLTVRAADTPGLPLAYGEPLLRHPLKDN
jgi:hypothetical protein